MKRGFVWLTLAVLVCLAAPMPPASAATLLGDINGDRSVDVIDLLYMVDSWGRSAGQPGFNAACDLDGNGSVDVIDLLTMIDNWGRTLPNPVLTLTQPATDLNPQVGTSITIHWEVQNPPTPASLYLYYDTDLIPNNQTEYLIDVVDVGTGEVGGTDYDWTIPTTLAGGTCYILGRLTDGQDTVQFIYAPGRVIISPSPNATRDLSRIGSDFAGVTFDGTVFGGRLGEVMAGGKDMNGDGYSDFVLVAPKSDSYWNPYPQSGEAYLIYSRGAAGRWPAQQTFAVHSLGSTDMQGVIFAGPSGSGTSSGIQDVIFIDDCDGDGLPEIVFGIPDVDRIAQDQQDYDPLDDPSIHGSIPPAVPGWTPGRYYYQADGWQFMSDSLDVLLPAGDDLRPSGWPEVGATNAGKRSGMIIYVSSQSTMANHIVLLDEVGGRVNVAHPRVAHGYGMRLYPVAGSDTSNWGAQLATADLFGTPGFPALLVARPTDDGGTGSVKMLVQEQMAPQFRTWTAAPDLGSWLVQPKVWSFPGADSTGGPDPDRIPKWPAVGWYTFMDSPALQTSPSDPARFNLTNSDKSVAANGHLGHPTNLKDFNGDMVEDLAVSSPDAAPAGQAQAGSAYIVYGHAALQGADVSQFASLGAAGFALTGTQAGEHLGWKMAGPGDLNNDGFNDWVLTAPNRSWAGRSNCGAVIIVYGRSLLYGSNTISEVVPNLQGTIIYGANAGDNLGMYLAAVGDVDRDGYPDIVVAAPGYDAPGRPNCGAAFLIYGGPHLVGSEFDIRDIGTAQLPGKVYIGPEANAGIGPVSAAGDTDNDYYQDFLIGYPGASIQGRAEAGRAWLIYGSRRQSP